MARSLIALVALLALAGCIVTSEAQQCTCPCSTPGATPSPTPATGANAASIISSIKQYTQVFLDLQSRAQQISIINGPLIAVGLGPFPPIIVGLTQAVQIIQSTAVSPRFSELPDLCDPVVDQESQNRIVRSVRARPPVF